MKGVVDSEIIHVAENAEMTTSVVGINGVLYGVLCVSHLPCLGSLPCLR